MSGLAGTGALVRLALRRDRVAIPVWLLGGSVLVLGTAASFAGLDAPGERERLAASVAAEPALRGLYGQPYDLSTIGGATAWRMGHGGAAILAGLMGLLLVVRHTRADEESGRAELVGSTVVGRGADLAAALTVAGLANAGLGASIALGLLAFGESPAGCVALGLAVAGTGCLFAAFAAACAQVASTARAAGGLAGALLAVAFVVRVVGDAVDNGLGWLSPFGWAEQVRPFAGDRWAVLLLPLGAAAALTGVAGRLRARRDLGAGLLGDRPGRPAASRSLRGPWSLAWRLHRGLLGWWLVGVVAGGALLGTLAQDLRAPIEDNPQLAEAFRRAGGLPDVVDAYLVAMVGLVALATAGFAVQVVLRLRTEETSGLAEPVLAGAVSRSAWSLSHLAVALTGAATLVLAAGTAMGLTDGIRLGDVGGQVAELAGIALGQVPAVWTLAALAFALAGLLPRWSALVWVALGACVLVGQLGTGLGLPDWVADLSPFAHAPRRPFEPAGVGPLAVTAAAAAALAALGLGGLRRRDLTS